MKVYVDGVMAVNFLVDLLLLLGTNRLSGFPPGWKRVLPAAALGAVYSGACLVPQFRFLGSTLWRVVFLGLMGGIAFGWSRSALRRCGVFVLLAMALGGLAVCLGRADIRVLALASLGLWCLSRLSFEGIPGSREYIPLQITRQGKTVKLLALRDTGNTLRDPITGEQALVISPWAAERLTGLTERQLRHPLETMTAGSIPGLRLIPFHTVGSSGGMMLAMTFEQVILGNQKRKALVAFAPENFDRNGAYQALTGGVTI